MDFHHNQNIIFEAMTGKWTDVLLYSLGALFILAGATVVYNLCLHPLAGFPGPKIAAATGWYEFWYDVVKRGQYIYEIEQMHKDYGQLATTTTPELVIDE